MPASVLPRALLLLGLLLAGATCALRSGSDAVLVIRHGGTYTGRYHSTRSGQACVQIATTEPVVLENCDLSGPGLLIDARAGGARLTIRNCRGVGEPPTEDNRARGRFLELNNGVHLLLEHCYLARTSGVLVYRWQGSGAPTQTLTVRYNQARNVDGRFRNGGGAKVSFLQLNEVHGLEHASISWNEVVNEPDHSMVEDIINLHNSSGTVRSPLLVQYNYLQGAYPVPATAPTFTGSGLTTDGDATSALTTTAYVVAHHNTVVSTCNAAMNIAAGHHNEFHHNLLVTSGLLPDGRRLAATYAGTSIFNAYKTPVTVFFGNRMHHNTIGFVRWGAAPPVAHRTDLSPEACTPCTDIYHLPSPVTLATEQQAYTSWQQQLRSTGQPAGLSHSLAIN